MQIRWGIFWDSLKPYYLYCDFFESVSCYRMPGEVWSMGIAYDTIDSLGEMKLCYTLNKR